ncbi:hypothetical protein HELRODRAFT_84746, partial [Helobdella robusta]|uniref:Large ribosomal subunit protein mL54 n=1 Tax=Helobdella robusta TaxID=6412 RepID=T1G5N2_HELRO
TDVKLLTSRLCGGNILKEGEDPVLKDKSEYPDWLWSLRLTRSPPPLEEIDQDSWQYWKRVNKLDKKRRGQELALKYKYHKF